MQGDLSELNKAGIPYDNAGYVLFVFDVVKLVLYTLYFGKQLINDCVFLCKHFNLATGSNYFKLLWNMGVLFCNIGNFVLFMVLSRNYDVNTMLHNNKHVDSHTISSYYQLAQYLDSFLVIMNILMMMQFTMISRRVSMIFKIIDLTAAYLFYIVASYLLALYLMAQVVWQLYGDKL